MEEAIIAGIIVPFIIIICLAVLLIIILCFIYYRYKHKSGRRNSSPKNWGIPSGKPHVITGPILKGNVGMLHNIILLYSRFHMHSNTVQKHVHTCANYYSDVYLYIINNQLYRHVKIHIKYYAIYSLKESQFIN